jgi:hypothetical protein
MPSLTQALGTSVTQAWSWWIGELGDLVPSDVSMRGINRSSAAVDISLSRENVSVERVEKGVGERFVSDQPLERLDPESWDELRALLGGARSRIILAPPQVFTTSLSLPVAARTRVRQAVALQMGEIAPLDPALLSWTVDDIGVTGDRLSVRVSMAKTAEIERIEAQFAEHDVPCPPIGLRSDEAFIILSKGAQQRRPLLGGRTARTALIVLGLIASVPITTSLFAWAIARQAEGEAAAIEERIQPKLAAEARWRRNETLRAVLAPIAALPSAGRLLNQLAANLPDSVYARAIELGQDGALRMTADAQDPDLVRPALAATPALARLREVAQTPTDDARIRVDYQGKL